MVWLIWATAIKNISVRDILFLSVDVGVKTVNLHGDMSKNHYLVI